MDGIGWGWGDEKWKAVPVGLQKESPSRREKVRTSGIRNRRGTQRERERNCYEEKNEHYFVGRARAVHQGTEITPHILGLACTWADGLYILSL
jgi:hypothetical protein